MAQDSDNFAELFQESIAKPIRRLNPGQKITATIAAISGETIFLDTGSKSEGILEAAELTDEEGECTAKVGDELEVYFLKAKGGEQLFTITLGSGKSSEHLEEAYRSNIPVEGLVKEEVKGGFSITLSGSIRGFCPYSQMGLRRVEDAAAEYVGKQMNFLISRFEEGGRNIVVSARAIQELEREKQRETLKETLAEGQSVDGTITSIRDFGAFVDIGGVDGLVPISEIGWSRVENIRDHYEVGQQVKVVVKKLDWDADRITLSIKETLEDPWDAAAAKLTSGTILTGRVARLAPFGAFVTLDEGVDGLIHISRMGKGRRINHPREVLEEGQEVEVQVESVDREEKRISLAPSDYESPESKEEKEQTLVKDFKKKAEVKSGSMGTLGDLLQAQLKKKK